MNASKQKQPTMDDMVRLRRPLSKTGRRLLLLVDQIIQKTGLTQDAVCRLMDNLGPANISHLRNGRTSSPSTDTLDKVKAGIGLRGDYFDEDEDPTSYERYLLPDSPLLRGATTPIAPSRGPVRVVPQPLHAEMTAAELDNFYLEHGVTEAEQRLLELVLGNERAPRSVWALALRVWRVGKKNLDALYDAAKNSAVDAEIRSRGKPLVPPKDPGPSKPGRRRRRRR